MPENHRNLRVRVTGFSDYFVNLSEPLQEDIIARTEQK
jgi:formate C-acetyltransferase